MLGSILLGNIRNPENYINSFWDWSILEGCFGETIKPSDVDGIVERKDSILVVETKRPGEEIPDAQRRTLEALGRKPKCTVIILRGHPNHPEQIKQFRRKEDKWSDWEPTSLDDLRRRCSEWFERANGNPAKF